MFKAKKIVDLSFPITSETPVYPGNPLPEITQVMHSKKDIINLHELSLGSQSGTHVDAAYHFIDEGDQIEKSPLDLFMGTAVTIPVLDKGEQEKITMENVEPFLNDIKPGKIVLFHTGWSKYAGEEKFYRHPYVDTEVIEKLIDIGVRTFAIDCINMDYTGGTYFPVHIAVAEVNGIILENMTNLDQIDFEDPVICAFPLALKGCDGSPVRAVALDL